MNIDKDIEIVKKIIEETQEEYSETLVDGKVYRIENIPLEFKPTKELANSISNVLLELERLQRENNTLTTQNAMMSKRHFKDSGKLKELETYKKIAEKLAEVVDLGYMPFECSPMCIHDNCIKECALDWAKREVEKDV